MRIKIIKPPHTKFSGEGLGHFEVPEETAFEIEIPDDYAIEFKRLVLALERLTARIK